MILSFGMKFLQDSLLIVILLHEIFLTWILAETKTHYFHLSKRNVSTASVMTEYDEIDKVECSLLCLQTDECQINAVAKKNGKPTCYLLQNKTSEVLGNMFEADVMEFHEMEKSPANTTSLPDVVTGHISDVTSSSDVITPPMISNSSSCKGLRGVPNGIYDFQEFSAYCDMETDGGR